MYGEPAKGDINSNMLLSIAALNFALISQILSKSALSALKCLFAAYSKVFIPKTFSVPLLKPLSCPPPTISGFNVFN